MYIFVFYVICLSCGSLVEAADCFPGDIDLVSAETCMPSIHSKTEVQQLSEGIFFGHIIQMDDCADAKILIASSPSV